MSEPKTDREFLEAIVATTTGGMMTTATSGAILAAERFLDLASPESDGARISIRENDGGEWLDFHAPSGKQASVLLTGGPIVRAAVRETVAAFEDDAELFPGTKESLDSLTIRGGDHE